MAMAEFSCEKWFSSDVREKKKKSSLSKTHKRLSVIFLFENCFAPICDARDHRGHFSSRGPRKPTACVAGRVAPKGLIASEHGKVII